MPASRSPADAGIGRDGWQLLFLVELRTKGNVSAIAGPHGAGISERPRATPTSKARAKATGGSGRAKSG